MAETSSDWANGPGPEVALSSDEEDFVSSESTASAEQEALTKHQLPSKLARLNLEVESSESCDKSVTRTQTSTPATAASIRAETITPTTKRPLQLLELPLDVLKDIIKEVTHTNDLTSLALTCSVMHALTVPHMYSRFDIVWPESLTPTNEEYAGVDALSYGLSTLVMGEDVYQHAPAAQCRDRDASCAHCGYSDHGYHMVSQSTGGISGALSRRGNNYAQFTRTFSIGNGPLSWVQEYSVNREVGKMLGTLVALAVSRMVNLETFIWDMPTGVVREIWLALASLADRTDGKCRLGRVWVRWHDNSDNALRIPTTVPASGTRLLQKYRHVEYPSLSVLPPLKSVTVLDIDESAYVEELGVLVERSRHCLLELRIGISMKARAANWLTCAKDVQASTSALSSWPRAGGILSILSKQDPQPQPEESVAPQSSQPDSTGNEKVNSGNTSGQTPTSPLAENDDLAKEPYDEKSPPPVASAPCPAKSSGPLYSSQAHPDKLNLEVLELERIPLSIPNLLPMIDWTRLTNLTIMGCREHENLWRALRRKYAPPPMPQRRIQPGERRRSSLSAQDYPLNIKHLRTDTVTPFLMLFIKDALAPNTLECVYLHESPDYESNVNVEAIYRHIIRRHRLSLTKMLFDASDRLRSSDNLSTQWHKWMFNHEMVSFVTSGRMPQLKELGMALHYRDWHYFLQRLPKMPQLRALYLPHISHCVHREMKELASSVLDIVSIRPDLKITYIGLHTKCYQILERTGSGNDFDSDTSQSTNSSVHPGDDGLSGLDEDALDALDTDDDDTGEVNQDLLEYSDDSDDSGAGNEEITSSSVHFRLQEILFYDDKISIFKMRHGVL